VLDKKRHLKAHTDNLKATEKQVGGDHYKSLKVQPIEFIQGNGLDFIEGNIVKYICRKDKIGECPHERWNKIIHYAQLGKEFLDK